MRRHPPRQRYRISALGDDAQKVAVFRQSDVDRVAGGLRKRDAQERLHAGRLASRALRVAPDVGRLPELPEQHATGRRTGDRVTVRRDRHDRQRLRRFKKPALSDVLPGEVHHERDARRQRSGQPAPIRRERECIGDLRRPAAEAVGICTGKALAGERRVTEPTELRPGPIAESDPPARVLARNGRPGGVDPLGAASPHDRQCALVEGQLQHLPFGRRRGRERRIRRARTRQGRARLDQRTATVRCRRRLLELCGAAQPRLGALPLVARPLEPMRRLGAGGVGRAQIGLCELVGDLRLRDVFDVARRASPGERPRGARTRVVRAPEHRGADVEHTAPREIPRLALERRGRRVTRGDRRQRGRLRHRGWSGARRSVWRGGWRGDVTGRRHAQRTQQPSQCSTPPRHGAQCDSRGQLRPVVLVTVVRDPVTVGIAYRPRATKSSVIGESEVDRSRIAGVAPCSGVNIARCPRGLGRRHQRAVSFLVWSRKPRRAPLTRVGSRTRTTKPTCARPWRRRIVASCFRPKRRRRSCAGSVVATTNRGATNSREGDLVVAR